MVLSMAPLHLLGHNDQNEVKHDFFSHMMPWVPALLPGDANCIINGTIFFTICLVLGIAMAQQLNICKIFQSPLYKWTMYVIKEIRCCTRWHLGFHSLFLNSAIAHSCILVPAIYICWYLPLILDIHQILLLDCVCIYRHAFRHILGFLPSFSVLRWWTCFMINIFLINGMYLPFCFFNVLPRASCGYIWCGFIPSKPWGSLITFPAL